VTRGEAKWHSPAVGGRVMHRGGRWKRTSVRRPGAKGAQGHRDELHVRNQ
jgi:hypothetical protein